MRLIPRDLKPVAARQFDVAAARRLALTRRLTVALLTLAFLGVAAGAFSETVMNLTGLPAYPNLSGAKMDSVARTDMLGHWCNRFAGHTFDSVEVVEKWYRKALLRASETDLKNDERYRDFDLSGIKLAVGIDYVTVYKMAGQPSTIIELFRCSPPT